MTLRIKHKCAIRTTSPSLLAFAPKIPYYGAKEGGLSI